MTKRDFERLALAVKSYRYAARAKPALGDCAAHFDLIMVQIINACIELNPAFQVAQFRAACRLED